MNEKIESAALKIAQACSYVVEPVLYEWEKNDVQKEFEAVIQAGLEKLLTSNRGHHAKST